MPKKDYVALTYEIEDGYAGGARPQHVEIPISEIHDCETLDEAIKLAEDYIQEDFNQKAYPAYNISEEIENCWNARPKD